MSPVGHVTQSKALASFSATTVTSRRSFRMGIQAKRPVGDFCIFIFVHSNFQGVIVTPLVGANLTPYSGVIFWGSYLNSKKEFKELFFRSKMTPDIEELK